MVADFQNAFVQSRAATPGDVTPDRLVGGSLG